MSSKKSPLVLVDGSSYLYRAFHALPALLNSKGFPTGAVYGVINMLKKLIIDYKPSHMAVIFDPRGKTFRDDIYPAYKATRTAMPSELGVQIEPIHRIIKAMGIPMIIVDGFEADDVIGTLAKHAHDQQLDTIISTGDKDLAQLVSDHIHLINTMSNTKLDEQGVLTKFGVKPSQIIDYLTLVGDTSDNIPGVPKVGPKTAAKWLSEYQTIDNLIAHADKITGKIGENLREFIPQISLSKSLVTIKQDVPLPLSIADLEIQASNQEALIANFKELEFKSWLTDAMTAPKTDDAVQASVAKKHYTTILDEKTLDTWLSKLNHCQLFAFDTETTSLDEISAEIVGVSFAIEADDAVYIPLAHIDIETPKQLDRAKVLAQLKPILENPDIKKIGQNIKYDMKVLEKYGIHLKGIQFDTMLESYILDSISNNHDMDSLALKHLGVKTITYEEIAGKGAKQITFDQIPVAIAAEYAAEDADITLKLHTTLWPRIAKEQGLTYVFDKIEMPLVSVLAKMEMLGVLIDPDQLRIEEKNFTKRLLAIEKNIFSITGKEFNISSPKQLQDILFNDLKLPVLQKTPTGQPSTADAVLQELAVDFELPKLIIEYRSLSKLISTYTNRLIEQIHTQTGRIHTSYQQTGTGTGRLSSTQPNLQNIPIRSEEGRLIRKTFIAPPNHVLVSADYSQIELRIMAHISEDPGLLQAFKNNIDIHQATAAEVFGVPLNEVTFEMRRHAKAINFGLIYGMSAFGLTKQIDVDRKAAENYIQLYFARYPNVKKYMETTKLSAKEKGYVETIWGRRLPLPEINSKQIFRQKAAERAAINAPLQGSSADIIKMAMIHIHEFLNTSPLRAKMIMQVHDELVFEVHVDDLAAVTQAINKFMTEVVTLRVPLQVSIGQGKNWDEASKH